jgi:hypothetical protein
MKISLILFSVDTENSDSLHQILLLKHMLLTEKILKIFGAYAQQYYTKQAQ